MADKSSSTDPALLAAADRLCTSTTDVLHTLANEPSVGLYYVSEHIQRSVPGLLADKAVIEQAGERLRGVELDTGFALEEMQQSSSGGTLSALANAAQLMALSSVTIRRIERQKRESPAG